MSYTGNIKVFCNLLKFIYMKQYFFIIILIILFIPTPRVSCDNMNSFAGYGN